MAPKTKAQLYTEIDTNYPDNTSGLITPAIQRTTEKDTVDSWQQAPVVNLQLGSAYTFTADDFGKLVLFNSAVAVGATLPQAIGTFANFNVMVANIGAGVVTITPTTSTIGGAASLALAQRQCQTIVSDGANYQLAQNTAVTVGGSGAFPVFNDPIMGLILRAIVSTDLPACQFAGLGAVKAFAPISNKFLQSLDEGGAFNAVQPDVSMFPAGQLRERLTAGRIYYVRTPPAPVSLALGSPGVVTWNAHGLAGNAEVFLSMLRGQTQGTAISIASPAVVTWAAATVTISIAANAVVTWTNHGFLPGQAVVFTTTGVLPTGITAGTTYYVVGEGTTGAPFTQNSFHISATPGGANINTSGSQSGTHTGTASHGFAAGQPVRFATTGSLPAGVAPATVAVTINIATSTVTWTGHGLVNGQLVKFTTTGALPTGIVLDQPYYVVGVAANTFQIALIAGGAAITLSGTQSGTHQATCTTPNISIASPAVVTWSGHGLVAGQQVRFSCTGALPTGVTTETPYYVIATGLTANSFQFSTTAGGAAVNTSGSQSGFVSAAPIYYVIAAGLGTSTFQISATPGGAAINTSGVQSGTHFGEKSAILPGGVVEGTTYFVVAASITANTFQVSATANGAAINFTGATEGQIFASTGSDVNNTGLSITSPFSSIQKAIDTAAALDLGIFSVVINVAGGTYTQALNTKAYVGTGPINVTGVAGTGNTTISLVAGTPFSTAVPQRYGLNSFRLTAQTAGFPLLNISRASQLDIQFPDFGPVVAAVQITMASTAIVNILSNYMISGGGNNHLVASANCTFACGGRTVMMIGQPFFSIFVFAQQGGIISYNANTFLGGTAGQSASVATNAAIDTALATNTAAANYLPGNHLFTEASGGVLV